MQKHNQLALMWRMPSLVTFHVVLSYLKQLQKETELYIARWLIFLLICRIFLEFDELEEKSEILGSASQDSQSHIQNNILSRKSDGSVMFVT